jgi:glutamate synthase (NADPH/NADH) small chain
MLKFTDTPQVYPDIKPADLRKQDFEEIYAQFSKPQAAEQAERCSQCGIPFCQVHCPLQNNIPDWLKLAAEGRLEEAYQISSATNTFPEICGRICPQDKLCEGNCVIEKDFGAVTIGSVERYITETAWEQGWVKPIKPGNQTGKSIGIIGAGPAGLAAADMLRRAGHEVHVYDRYDRVGGLMIYGIPNFKLEKSVVIRRHKLLEQSGVKFHSKVSVGEGSSDNIRFAELQARHDALLIATGVYKARALQAPNSAIGSIIPALPYLTESNRHGLGDKLKNQVTAKDKEVVVVGGGDTAMDCVRTAIRQGARSVTCLYRRDQANMPGSQREVKNAMEEGVNFHWLAAPKGFIANAKGDVKEVIVQRMRLAPSDTSFSSTRNDVIALEGSNYNLKADLVIPALGFEAEDIPQMFGQPQLAVNKNGTLKVDKATMQTSIPGVFAAGDIVRGASLVVWAIKDGRDVAQSINAFLKGKEERLAA